MKFRSLLLSALVATTGIVAAQSAVPSPPPELPMAPPPAVQFPQVSTDWIDLPAYLRTNPVWPIDRP